MPNARHTMPPLRQVLGSRRESGADPGHAYARARLETALLTEHYYYEQVISRNPFQRQTGTPTGHIEMTLPYDGHTYFTRQACADVAGAGNRVSQALVGHLMVVDHSHTDLARALGPTAGYGSIPVLVPVDPADPARLHDDEHRCVIRYDYTPDQDALRVVPVDVDMVLVDPDGVELHDLLLTESVPKDTIVDEVAQRITQQVSFRPFLQLGVTVSLHVAGGPGVRELKPKVAKVSLDWPTITSLGALKLSVPGWDGPMRYNPLDRAIEWSDVPMARVETDETGGDTVTFRSRQMLLRIEQPGELYRQSELTGRVDVEIPGGLLSGVRARLFDAVGALRTDGVPELRSTVSSELTLTLDDAFSSRLLLPYQHLYFDEVIPDEMRIADIVTALKDKGFDLEFRHGQRHGEDFRRDLLVASRAEGPDTMRLWVFVEGRRYQTERRNQVPGGHTFKSTFDSGDLKVFLCGALPGTSRELTHVMNALQQTLRERFERLKSRR